MCGSNKAMCDDQFESCMEKSCKELPALKDDLADMDEEDIQEAREKCKRMIGLVKMLDNMGGCGRYNLYQANSCECVEKEKAKDKMKSVLEGFYGKYKPNAIGKGTKLCVRLMFTFLKKCWIALRVVCVMCEQQSLILPILQNAILSS